jgi:hypothetical protein
MEGKMATEDEMIAAVEKAVMEVNEATALKVYAPKANGGGQVEPADIGAENMEQFGAISAKGIRDMYAECARRELEAAQALLAQAQSYVEEAKVRARAAEQLGDEMAKSHLAAVDRARKMAAHAATTRALIEAAPERAQ